VRRGALQLLLDMLHADATWAGPMHGVYQVSRLLHALCAANESARNDAIACCVAEMELEARKEDDDGIVVRWVPVLTRLVGANAPCQGSLQAATAEAALQLLARCARCTELVRRCLLTHTCCYLLMALAQSSPVAAERLRAAGAENVLRAALDGCCEDAMSEALTRALAAVREG
jgi:hypothetical protein